MARSCVHWMRHKKCVGRCKALVEDVPPRFGTQQIFFLLGILNRETTWTDYNPVTVSFYQSLVGDANRRPSSTISSAKGKRVWTCTAQDSGLNACVQMFFAVCANDSAGLLIASLLI